MKRDIYSEVTARILQSLEAGVKPWDKPYSLKGRKSVVPMNAISNRPYSGVNVLLFWLSADKGYSTPRYLTFKQAKECGGHVRKGEESTRVIFFKSLSVTDKASGEEKQIPVVREYYVFNVDQCDDLPDHVRTGKMSAPAIVNPDSREDLADAFIKSTGAVIREGTAGTPCYIPSRDMITVPAFDCFKSNPDFYGTMFHELIHWSGAKSRLDRDLSGRFGTSSYAAEELVAEIGAAFVNAEFGFDKIDQNAAYVASWIQLLKDDSRAIFTAASKAQQAADYLRSLALAETAIAA